MMVVFNGDSTCNLSDEKDCFSKKLCHALIERYTDFLTLQCTSECKYACLISPKHCITDLEIILLSLFDCHFCLGYTHLWNQTCTLDTLPWLEIIMYIYYLKVVQFEVVTVNFSCLFRDWDLLQRPTNFLRQNTKYCKEPTLSQALLRTSWNKGRKFRFWFSKAFTCRFYRGIIHHVGESESPPAVSKDRAEPACSDSIQKRAALHTHWASSHRTILENDQNQSPTLFSNRLTCKTE